LIQVMPEGDKAHINGGPPGSPAEMLSGRSRGQVFGEPF
jgi:hypothetical protein